MESSRPPTSNGKLQSGDDGEEVTQKLFIIQSSDKSGKLEQKPVDSTDTATNRSSKDSSEVASNSQNDSFEAIDSLNTVRIPTLALQEASGQELQEKNHTSLPSRELAFREHEKAAKKAEDRQLERSDTHKFPAQVEMGITQEPPTTPLKTKQ